jgi:hypothetical protein
MKRKFVTLAVFSWLLVLAGGVAAGEWSENEFLYKPAVGARGVTEKTTFDTGLNRVDSHLGKYKTLGDPRYTTLSEALQTIGNSPVTLTIPAGTVAVTGNLTVPANVTLHFLQGGVLNVSSGVTLTLNGPLVAGPYQIFSGTGTVVLGGPVTEVYPQWWGAKGDGVTDDTPAIQAALNQGGGRTVKFPKPAVAYKLTTEVCPVSHSRLIGEYSTIHQSTPRTMIFAIPDNRSNIEIAYFRFTGTGVYTSGPNSGRCAVHSDRGEEGSGVNDHFSIHHNIFDGSLSTGGIGGTFRKGHIYQNHITITNGEHGIYLAGNSSDVTIENNVIIGPGTPEATASGIKFTAATNLVIRGNILEGWRHSNINAGGGAPSDIVIQSNILKSTLAGAGGSGIHLTYGQRFLIMDNDIRNSAGCGLLSKIPQVTIKHNLIRNSGGDGIFIDGRSGADVRNTVIDGNLLDGNNSGISLNTAQDGIIVTNNYCTGSVSGYGITFSNTTTVNGFVGYNTIYGGSDPLTLSSNLPTMGNITASGTVSTLARKTVTATLSGPYEIRQNQGNVFLLNPNGAHRNVNPVGNFSPGTELTVVNTAGSTYNLVFDSSGLNITVAPGKTGMFVFDGNAWKKVFVSS